MSGNTLSIQTRSRKFAVRIINAYTEIKKNYHFDDAIVIIFKQLLRSGTSIGANCAEAKSAQSTKDFIHKYEIALKEAQETQYWLEIIIEAKLIHPKKLSLLLDEVSSIIKILAASIKSLKNKNS